MMLHVHHLLGERQRQGHPVRVAIAGCGFVGRALVNQILNTVPGMTLSAIAARDLDEALKALVDAGVDNAAVVDGVRGLRRSMHHGITAVTEDFSAITQADGIDVVVDVTGAVEFGCRLALDCFAGGKHLVLMNAEVDATVGTELSRLADAAGVVVTGCDGDLPGAQLNLIRLVRSIGLAPLVIGTTRGRRDRHCNPDVQGTLAQQPGQSPWMLTRFADGTRTSVEQIIVGNASGMSVHRRGVLDVEHSDDVHELAQRYDIDELRALGGVVDYLVRDEHGVFCLGAHDTGALHSFWAPYRSFNVEVPITAARAVLLGDTAVRALPIRHVEAVTIAKVDLRRGTVLDCLGGFHYYGEAEKACIARDQRLLPVGAAEGCTVIRDLPKDATLTYDDVIVPPGRFVDRLLAAQARMPASLPPALVVTS